MKILILDIETTNFLKPGGSIVEIGIVELNLSNGKIETIFNSLLKESILSQKHRKHPFGWIFNNSDLTVEMVRDAPPADKIFPIVQTIIDTYENGCTAFNNDFDFNFLEDRGIKFPKKLPCLMKISKDVCKIPNKNGYSGYKNPNAEEAYKHFFPESNYIEAHRGNDDAVHEAEMAYELYKMGAFKVE